ncbi:hypothetical protein C8J56DRAFT_881268 [Mycena floridula]|nr:hypothetical protein C8J56DRAFT_881268 [Mycena floridula]
MLFNILAQLEADPLFTSHININTVVQYLDLASRLKDVILLTQDANHDADRGNSSIPVENAKERLANLPRTTEGGLEVSLYAKNAGSTCLSPVRALYCSIGARVGLSERSGQSSSMVGAEVAFSCTKVAILSLHNLEAEKRKIVKNEQSLLTRAPLT